MTALCPECLCVWTTHSNNRQVQGLGFTATGAPVSNLPRVFCPDCKTPPRPKKGKR